MLFYEDNKKTYYSGTGLSQGCRVTFGQIFKRTHGDSFTPLTVFTVDSTTKEGLTAEANGNALTISVAGDCEPGESFVILTADNVKYALCVNVHESSGGQGGQGGPPPFAGDVQTFINSNLNMEPTEAGKQKRLQKVLRRLGISLARTHSGSLCRTIRGCWLCSTS